MTIRIYGPRTWKGNRDVEGYRGYSVKALAVSDAADPNMDGPANILQAIDIAYPPGRHWAFSGTAEIDIWAWRTLETDVYIDQEREGDKPRIWGVDLKFTTRPSGKRCMENQIDNPLLRPQEISGSFVKYQEEADKDRFGRPLVNSAHEQFRGPHVEFDRNRPQVKINQNVANLQLPLLASLIDHVNDSVLWGLGPRKVKLSNVSWSRQFYGTCNLYYQRQLEFDVNYDTFDRDLLDEGSKVLKGHIDRTGHWHLDNIAPGVPPDPLNPLHFIRFQTADGNVSHVVLNGAGLPAKVFIGTGSGTASGEPAYIHVEKYPEGNLLLLGIPSDLADGQGFGTF